MKCQTQQSKQKANTGNTSRKRHKLPPDPDGLFKRAAKRGKKLIAFYEELDPGLARDDLVSNVLHDLMHLCDRDEMHGNFHQGHGFALYLYQDLLAENLSDVGRCNDEEAAWKAAGRIMFREA